MHGDTNVENVVVISGERELAAQLNEIFATVQSMTFRISHLYKVACRSIKVHPLDGKLQRAL